LIFERDYEAPAPPPGVGPQVYWDQVADQWLATRLLGITSDGPKRAILRPRGQDSTLGTAERVHRNTPYKPGGNGV
jgi:hypothetical protein